MSSPVPGSDIFDSNPYESHPTLTPLEAEVLWEYAKLAQHLKEVSVLNFFTNPQVASHVTCKQQKAYSADSQTQRGT
jgi:hypothetical protein